MADRPSEDPDFPQLRRFRFDPDGSGIAREVPRPDAEPPETEAADEIAEPPSSSSYDDPPATFRDDPDDILASSSLPDFDPPPPLRPAPRAVRDDSDDDRVIEQMAHGAAAPQRSKMPLLLGIGALIAVLAVVAWFILKPTGDDDKSEGSGTATSSSQQSASRGSSEQPGSTDSAAGSGSAGSAGAAPPLGGPGAIVAAQWGDQVCQSFLAFNEDAEKLRKDLSRAAKSSGTSASDLKDLANDGFPIVAQLDDHLRSAPSGNDAALTTLQKSLTDATNKLVDLFDVDSNNFRVTDPPKRAGALKDALDVPFTTLKAGLAALDPAMRDTIRAQTSCSSLGI